MAQSLVHRHSQRERLQLPPQQQQFMPETQMSSESRSSRWEDTQDFKLFPMTSPNPDLGREAVSQNKFYREVATLSEPYVPIYSAPMEHMVPPDLIAGYSPVSDMSAVSPWTAPSLVPGTIPYNESDVDIYTSSSPESFLSDFPQPYSMWNPQATAPMMNCGIILPSKYEEPMSGSFPGYLHRGQSIALPPLEHPLDTRRGVANNSGTNPLYAQTIESGPAQWEPSEYSGHQSGLTYHRYLLQPADPTSGRDRQSEYQTIAPRRDQPRHDEQQSDEPRTIVFSRDPFQIADNSDSKALRQVDDEILLECKKQGLTYKDIQDKLNVPVAESTLRGRYRSLTKDRKDRVRKPVWKSRDIQLLRDAVHTEFIRLSENYRSWNHSQKLGKVSWKRVAEYILENGGSYHFGNSTCKKKWAEVGPGR